MSARRLSVKTEIDAAADFCYITTRGRVTGKPHTIEIWFGLDRGTLYVLAGSGRRADFVRNVERHAAVEIRVGTRRSPRIRASARIVTAKAEGARARRLLLDKYAKADDNLDEWGHTALPVAFDLDAPD